MLVMLAKEQGLHIKLLARLLAKGVNSAALLVYRITAIDVTITNLRGKKQT